MKNWYTSKTVWLAILLTIAGIADFVGGLLTQGPITWQSVSMIVSGVVAVIIRVWYTNAPIQK